MKALVKGIACEHPAKMLLDTVVPLAQCPWCWITLGAKCIWVPMARSKAG
jgi:hypothetical protein